jgi:hypothetical protein
MKTGIHWTQCFVLWTVQTFLHDGSNHCLTLWSKNRHAARVVHSIAAIVRTTALGHQFWVQCEGRPSLGFRKIRLLFAYLCHSGIFFRHITYANRPKCTISVWFYVNYLLIYISLSLSLITFLSYVRTLLCALPLHFVAEAYTAVP